MHLTLFLIIGVQKNAGPPRGNDVCHVELTTLPDFIEQGRKKHNTLLRHHASRQATDQPSHPYNVVPAPQMPALLVWLSRPG